MAVLTRIRDSWDELLRGRRLARQLLEEIEKRSPDMLAISEGIEELRRIHRKVSKRSVPEVYKSYASLIKFYADSLDSLATLRRVMLAGLAHRESRYPEKEYEAIREALLRALELPVETLEPAARIYVEKG